MPRFLTRETWEPVFAVSIKSEDDPLPKRGGSQSARQVPRRWRLNGGASIMGLWRYVYIGCRVVEVLRSTREAEGLASAMSSMMIQVYIR
ncbi:hypothetical protein RSAG8_10130, partial [Rhizoctonia solani AG-8 WAC10335]